MKINTQLIIAVIIAALAFVISTSAAELTLSWSDNSDNEKGFIVEASENGGDFTEIGTTGENVASFVVNIPEEKRDIEYVYRVVAFNFAGKSDPSNTVDAKGKYFEPIKNNGIKLQIYSPSVIINAQSVIINQK